MNSRGNNAQSTTIILSSIPFDQTEEQLLDLCNSVGPVKSLKMIFDPLNGRSKGTCYIDYKDLKTSSSAVRNLNGYMLGGRNLKCRYADSNDPNVISMKSTEFGAYENQNNGLNNSNNFNSTGGINGNGNAGEEPHKLFTINNQIIRPETIGIDVNTTMTTPAMMLSSTISTYSQKEQYHLLQLLKQESNESTGMTLKLLKEFPQLSYAVAEILLTNGLTNVEELTQLAIDQEDAADAAAAAAAGGPSNENPDSMDGFSGEENNISPRQLKQQQVTLLRKVLQLSDAEISLLPQDEKVMVYDLQQRAMRGDFGLI